MQPYRTVVASLLLGIAACQEPVGLENADPGGSTGPSVPAETWKLSLPNVPGFVIAGQTFEVEATVTSSAGRTLRDQRLTWSLERPLANKVDPITGWPFPAQRARVYTSGEGASAVVVSLDGQSTSAWFSVVPPAWFAPSKGVLVDS